MNDIPDRIAFLMKRDAITSMRKAADRYGIGYEVFKKIASANSNDPRRLTFEHAKAIADYHNVPAGWLVFNEGSPGGPQGIQLEGKIGAGQEMKVFENPGTEYVVPEEIVGPDAIAFEVEGDSMRPLAREGDFVFVGPARRDIKALIGEECAVLLEDGRRFFKIIESGSEPGRFDLLSHNSAYAPMRNVAIHSAGPLIAVKRRASKIPLHKKRTGRRA